MKKIIIGLSLIITVVFITVFLSFDNGTATPQKTTLYIKVTGCQNCDNMKYCIDGGQLLPTGGCNFTVNVSEGTHKICVFCSPEDTSLAGGTVVECSGGTMTIGIDITPNTQCTCGTAKKK